MNIDSRFKSYGTVLRDHPEVDEQAKKLFTFLLSESDKNIKKNNLPKKYTKDNPSPPSAVSMDKILPRGFRGHYVWKNYITMPDSLGKCGLDWGMALCHCMSDRLGIFSFGQVNVSILPTEILYCANLKRPQLLSDVKSQSKLDLTNLCVGYSVYDAAKYIYQYGISDANCFSDIRLEENDHKIYTDFNSMEELKSKYPTCEKLIGDDREHCVDKKTARRVYKLLSLINVEADDKFLTIKYEIFKYGPVVGGFLMYRDFLENYDGLSIYKGPPPNSEFLGGHTIRILGWGFDEKENIEFWICANNWSTSWGEGGYFKMKMGIPECMLEKNIVAPIVDLSQLDFTYEPVDVLKIPQEWHEIHPDITNPTTLYTPYATQLIKDKKLKGELNPIFYKDYKLDKDTFWAADIDFYVKNYEDIMEQQTIGYYSIRINTIIVILIGILIAIYIYNYFYVQI